MVEVLKYVLTFACGGLSGSILTNVISWQKNKLQKMDCKYIDDDILSKLPIKDEDGIDHDNIYVKHFELKNTTNKDINEFKIIFQFDNSATILKYQDITKSGCGTLKMKKVKQNECTFTIKNFNRKDKIKFTFQIANITNDIYYIAEDGCLGFKIKTKDCRKKKLATKAKQSTNVLTIPNSLSKAEINT